MYHATPCPQCLKKKKLLENEVENLDNMIMRVVEQRTMIEGQRTTVEVVSSMHSAAMTAKENLKAMKIENVDQVCISSTESWVASCWMAPTQLSHLVPLGLATTGTRGVCCQDERLWSWSRNVHN